MTNTRILPSNNTQLTSHQLRNELCRLDSYESMAEVSSHLRNYAIAEVIGFLGRLDGHPNIESTPILEKGPAKFQQARGTIYNPFTHVMPCNLLLSNHVLNRTNLQSFFNSPKAKDTIARIFGMGVMAPIDFKSLEGYLKDDRVVNPLQVNIVDNIAEAYMKDSGLVNAAVLTAQATVQSGSWDASGKHKYTEQDELEGFIRLHYDKWEQEASYAYDSAYDHLTRKLDSPQNSNNQNRIEILEQRLEILSIQRRVFENDIISIGEVAQAVLAATVDEEEEWKNIT